MSPWPYSRQTPYISLSFQRDSYEGLSEATKPELLELIGKLPCAITQALVKRTSKILSRNTLLCEVCDGKEKIPGDMPEKINRDFEELWKTFNGILPRLSRTPGPRIAAMVALRRILVHSPVMNQLYLSSSAPGEFCHHSLRSSIRELRIATG